MGRVAAGTAPVWPAWKIVLLATSIVVTFVVSRAVFLSDNASSLMSKFNLSRNNVEDLRSDTPKLDELNLLESRWYDCSAENIEAQRVSFAALADPGWYGGCHGHDVLKAIHRVSPGRCGKVLIDVGANKGVRFLLVAFREANEGGHFPPRASCSF
jgi:hypothetical protein